jgi:hypothetical protein
MAELTVRCSWQPAGQIALVGAMLMFPRVPDAPGVYRFTMNDAAGARIYVGESERLTRRFQHYRTPGGPGERRTTKFRLNQLMREALEAGGYVMVEVAIRAEAAASDGTLVALDLNEKAVRRRAESAAQAAARAAGHILLTGRPLAFCAVVPAARRFRPPHRAQLPASWSRNLHHDGL